MNTACRCARADSAEIPAPLEGFAHLFRGGSNGFGQRLIFATSTPPQLKRTEQAPMLCSW